MKILYISRRFYPDIIGGGQISALYIAKAAKMAGHDVYVCTFTDNKKIIVDNIEGITIYRIPLPKLKFSKILSNLDYMYMQMALLSSKIIKNINPDILHLLNFETIPLASIYYKLRFKKKIVATVNGPLFGCFTQNGLDYNEKVCINCRLLKRFKCTTKQWGSFKGIFYYIYSVYFINMLKLSYKFVDKFFAVSSAMVPLLENMNIPSNKISVVHNPVDKLKTTIKTDLKKELKIGKKKVILYAGRLAKVKGIQTTIKSMRYIDNAIYLIVGSKKHYYFELEKLVEKYKLQDKVKFVDFVMPKKLIEYYSICDVFVLITSMYDALPRNLLEAGSYGLPLITTNRGGCVDIVDKKTGLVLKNINDDKKLAELINKILKNKKIRTSMSKNIKEKIEKKFAINPISNILNKEYNSLIYHK